MPIPPIDFGQDIGYSYWLDFTEPYAAGTISDDYLSTVVNVCWEVVSQIILNGQPIIRLTTINPGFPGRWSSVGLRSGEFISCRFTRSPLAWIGAVEGGFSPMCADRVVDLYTPCECFVTLGPTSPQSSPVGIGLAAAHEFGHTALPSWPGSKNGHTSDPNNIMYGGQLTRGATWNQDQLDSFIAGFDRLRTKGQRYVQIGDVHIQGKANDGGRPAWPLV